MNVEDTESKPFPAWVRFWLMSGLLALILWLFLAGILVEKFTNPYLVSRYHWNDLSAVLGGGLAVYLAILLPMALLVYLGRNQFRWWENPPPQRPP
jgi:hypothetical protein